MGEKEGTRQAGLPLPIKICQQCDQGGTDIYGRPRTACCHRAFCPAGSLLKKLLPKSCFQSHSLLPGFKNVYIFPSSHSIYAAVKFQAPGQRKTTTWWLSPISTLVLGHPGVLGTEARDWKLWRKQGQVVGGSKGTEINWVPTMHPPCGGTLYASSQSNLTPLQRHWDLSNWQMLHARLSKSLLKGTRLVLGWALSCWTLSTPHFT